MHLGLADPGWGKEGLAGRWDPLPLFGFLLLPPLGAWWIASDPGL